MTITGFKPEPAKDPANAGISGEALRGTLAENRTSSGRWNCEMYLYRTLRTVTSVFVVLRNAITSSIQGLNTGELRPNSVG